ncbi:ImmA/IrrE family metallo-endopeptidase [bacterium]|nr:ImmA/IrrE family metallo-endopeptidase [bacterium]
MGIPTRFYKEAEEKVVDLLVDCGMMRFPVDPFFLARMKGIEVRNYSALDAEKRLACSVCKIDAFRDYDPISNKYMIYYDEHKSEGSIRFSLLHELGHIILGHKEESTRAETLADYFAGYAIAPPVIIDRMERKTISDIVDYFGVTELCAEVRLKKYRGWKQFSIRAHEKRLLKHLGYNA